MPGLFYYYGNAEDWFKTRGMKFIHDMNKMNPRFENGSFIIEAKDENYGAVAKEFKGSNAIKDAKQLKIVWGVNQFPKGADWSGPKTKKRNTREAIAVIISFGTEKSNGIHSKAYIKSIEIIE